MKLYYWILAARPKTLIAAIAPVVLGSIPCPHPFLFFLALLGGLSTQIATNFANDLFDHRKGCDTSERKGPLRVMQQGLLSSKEMILGISLSLATTLGVSFLLATLSSQLFLILGIVSSLLAILYTAGPFALAYLGVGDLFAFLFFGPIPSLSATYLQQGSFSTASLFMGIGCGAISTAILTANNLRDVEEDLKVSKKTVAVRFGKTFALCEYWGMITLSLLMILLLKLYWIYALLQIAVFFILNPKKEPSLQRTALFLMIYLIALGISLTSLQPKQFSL